MLPLGNCHATSGFQVTVINFTAARASAGAAVLHNDLYIIAGYAGASGGGYLSDAWSLRLLDEAAECQVADFGSSERCARHDS